MMKQIAFIFKCFFLASALILSVSCSAEDGMDGEVGAQGPAGPAGQDGADGNANVTSVIINNVNLTAGQNTINVPELTRDIANNGLVQVYIQGGEDVWLALPLTLLQQGDENSGDQLITAIELTAIAPQQVVLFSLLTEVQTVNLRFVLVEGTPSTVVLP